MSSEQFFSIIPEKDFYNEILNYKNEIFKRFGKGKYLLDTPHITLYVGSFDYNNRDF